MNDLPDSLVKTQSFLVSFPRSGSNFVQNVLRQSGGGRACAIHAQRESSETITNFKSHAPSPAYLAEEAHRLTRLEVSKHPVAILIRDPRDAMVSFYEYTVAVRAHNKLDPVAFALEYDYFLAAPIDKLFVRQVEVAPMSVIDAYERHLLQWTAAPPPLPNMKLFRYESFLNEPERAFASLFAFLGLDISLDTSSLSEQMSLYSSGPRKRGVHNGAAELKGIYAGLCGVVESRLSEVMHTLGYA